MSSPPSLAAFARRSGSSVYNLSDRRRVRVVFGADGTVTCVVKSEDMLY
jgi:hypothetical protein